MSINQELKEIYQKVLKMDMMDLKKAYEEAETEEEFEFYKDLFVYRLQQNQKKVINQKEFVM